MTLREIVNAQVESLSEGDITGERDVIQGIMEDLGEKIADECVKACSRNPNSGEQAAAEIRLMIGRRSP